ncbi:hypothetical protein DL93DRAFT_1661941 [Clavulina sp. PMI_390]|nr:hypothetical protein DL93DRAFT_1661941 [Clavulina sp. PMI_390]
MISTILSFRQLRSLHLNVAVLSPNHRDECQIFSQLLRAEFAHSTIKHLALTGEFFCRCKRESVAQLLSRLPLLEALDFTGIHLELNIYFEPKMLPRLAELCATTVADVSVAVGSSLEHLDLSCGRIHPECYDALVSFMTTSLESLRSLQIQASGTLETLYQIFEFAAIFPRLNRLHVRIRIMWHHFLSVEDSAPILATIEKFKSDGGLGSISDLVFTRPGLEYDSGELFIHRCFEILGKSLDSLQVCRRVENERGLEEMLLVHRDSSQGLIFTALDKQNRDASLP